MNVTQIRSVDMEPWTIVAMRVGNDIVVDVYHDDDDQLGNDDARFSHRVND